MDEKIKPEKIQDRRLGIETQAPAQEYKKKYMKFQGNLNRTPFGWALTVFLSDKLLDVIEKRHSERV